MKKLYILLIMMFLMNMAMGQSKKPCVSCLPQGIDFMTQAQIDSFQINYPNCTQIEGGLLIGWMGNGSNISNLTGLSVITSVGGELALLDNDSLTNLSGLNNLTSTGSLSIWYHDNLTSLAGLDGLNSISGLLSIGSNTALISLAGLEGLTSIGGFQISSNDALISIMGLNNVTTFSGTIMVSGNPVLASLSGLDNIESDSITNLAIENNISLSNCAVQSICSYLISSTGNIEIQDNATGCNSQQEVKDSCTAIGVESFVPFSPLTIYPNPTSSQITIETPLKGSLAIINLNNQELLRQEISIPTTTIDVRNLPSGVYFVKITGEMAVHVGKIIKE